MLLRAERQRAYILICRCTQAIGVSPAFVPSAEDTRI